MSANAQTNPAASRRSRPSRARGLRASTGCLTCRRRRIKCDEGRPRCSKCCKGDRDCVYGKTTTFGSGGEGRGIASVDRQGAVTNEAGIGHDRIMPTLFSASPEPPIDQDLVEDHDEPIIPIDSALQDVSIPDPDLTIPTSETSIALRVDPIDFTRQPLINASAFEWFDLLAQDAINDIQRHNNVASGSNRWNFDETSLSRRPSPERELGLDSTHQPPSEALPTNPIGLSSTFRRRTRELQPSWNTSTPILIVGDDLVYFKHYINVIGPLLDLYDPEQHFTDVVPHLAVHNNGLLKSMLAVAARHMSKTSTRPPTEDRLWLEAEQQPSPGSQAGSEKMASDPGRIATKYYYETLQYLSQTLSFQSYADSHEILATAMLIMTYEMLECTESFNNSNWERHLRGAFWIQRCQDNDGETQDGLKRSVWWNWLRQDLFSSFLAGRPALTIWNPKKDLQELDADEYARRIVWISAKVIDFANANPDAAAKDIQNRINEGDKLYCALQEWHSLLPDSFSPLAGAFLDQDANLSINDTASLAMNEPSPQTSAQGATPSLFTPIWIHPESHAAAIQTYHFAIIVLLLHMPTAGGLKDYKARQRQFSESVDTICGIASYKIEEGPLTLVHVQALYAAGLCVQSPAKRTALVELLEKTLHVSNFPSKDLVKSLAAHWGELA